MTTHENPQNDREQQSSHLLSAGAALLSLSAARSRASEHHSAHKAEQDRTSPFWRVFGAALLSIAALVIITLIQQFSSILTEVCQDLNRMHEARAELARKEEVAAVL
jgi:heme exporter protein D